MTIVKELKRKQAPVGFRTEVVVITPDIAAAWLETNEHNRAVSRRLVEKYARDMTAGHFKLTGDAIRFSADRQLLDGQHRLLACIKADVPFESVVVYGLAPETKSLIDTGRPRSVPDMLALQGAIGAVALAGACRRLLQEKHQVRGRAVSWSHSDVNAFLEKHPQLPSHAREVKGQRMPRGISQSQLAAMSYVGSVLLKEPETASAFVAVFKHGMPAYPGCPAHRLRERLLLSPGGPTGLKPDEVWKGLKHAWNLFSKRQPVTRLLRWPREVEIEGLDLDAL